MNTTELKELAESAKHAVEHGHTRHHAESALKDAITHETILELITQLEDAQGEIRALRATEAGLRERVKALEDGLVGFKARVNTLAALGLKAERFDFGGRLKYDMTALLEQKP